MVYCSKCGHQNPDGAQFCEQCREPMVASSTPKKKREMEEECFGVPHGSTIFGIIIGIIVILWGFSMISEEYFGFTFDVWGNIWWIFLIIIGLFMIAGGIFKLKRG